jgi:hypothetical protein
MQPIGAAFFEAYVKPSAQYNNHDFDSFIRLGMHEMLLKCLAQTSKNPATYGDVAGHLGSYVSALNSVIYKYFEEEDDD